MTLQQLIYVVEITQSGSISEAAKKLFVSQPSLSNALLDLEKELGINIFVRTNKGVLLSAEGTEFLGYARQIVEQASMIENRYHGVGRGPQRFGVSTQHYAFAVNAFVDLVKENGQGAYDFVMRETRTYEIIEDVKNLKSEIGILYMNDFNNKVLNKLLKESGLVFTSLFTAAPHIFVSTRNPLVAKESVTLQDLEDYPCLSFEQGEYNSFHFSEEIQSTLLHRRNIKVSDRATLFNLLIGLDGYTISTGILSSDLNGNQIIAIPLDLKEKIRVGYIVHDNFVISELGRKYISALKDYAASLPYDLAMARDI